MYELKKNWEVIYEKICWAPGHRLIKKRIYGAVVSQRLRNTGLGDGLLASRGLVTQ
jgi:hypothetical protein